MRKNRCFPCIKHPVYEFCDSLETLPDPRPINFADFNARGGGGLTLLCYIAGQARPLSTVCCQRTGEREQTCHFYVQ